MRNNEIMSWSREIGDRKRQIDYILIWVNHNWRMTLAWRVAACLWCTWCHIVNAWRYLIALCAQTIEVFRSSCVACNKSNWNGCNMKIIIANCHYSMCLCPLRLIMIVAFLSWVLILILQRLSIHLARSAFLFFLCQRCNKWQVICHVYANYMLYSSSNTSQT